MADHPIHPNIIEATRLTREGKLGEALKLLRGTVKGSSAGDGLSALGEGLGSLLERVTGGLRAPLAPPAGDDGLLDGSFANAAGRRSYRLHLPAARSAEPPPLVVMLHGCTQDPDDFAAGTRMSRLAEAEGMAVLYPAQDGNANPSRCWNWFQPGDQRRDAGEPSILAGMVREVVSRHRLATRRIYVAGLSAGGAATSVLAATYPDLFAAAGVHSGLPYKAAHDMPSAFAAMRDGSGPVPSGSGRFVPTIVIHGDRDTTVSPVNAGAVVAQARARGRGVLQPTAAVEHGRSAGGIAYTRSVHADRAGRAMLEHWTLHGLGHAWSGGSTEGSYTDPRGPDASRAMLRFFRQHALEPAA